MRNDINFVIKKINPTIRKKGEVIPMSKLEETASKIVDAFAPLGEFDGSTDLEELKIRVIARLAYDREVSVAPAKILEDKKSTPWLQDRLETGDLIFKNWELYKEEISYLNSSSFYDLDASTDLVLDKSGNP